MAKKILSYQETRKLHQAGELTKAKEGYTLLLKNQANHVEALHGLAIICAQENNFNEALRHLNAAIKLQPKNPVLYLHLANVLKNLGRLDDAIDILHQIIKLDPNCISAYNNLGIIYYSQNNFLKAIEAYDIALQKQPDYIDAHYNLSLALIKNKEFNRAISLLENLLKNAPAHNAARFHLACTYMLCEKYSLAEKNFLIIDENQPNHFETKTNLATAYLKQGALLEAKKHYLKALELIPEDTQILFNLGVLYTQLDNIDSAIQYYQKAVCIDPDYFAAHNNLGTLFIMKQHPSLALRHFKEALRLQPSNTSISYTVEALSKNQRLLSAPNDYITTLFDAYADHYDAHLIEALDYRVPQLLHNVVNEAITIPKQSWDILDLGCGTGLCASPFKSAAKHLVGVDLSTNMLREAKQKNIYDELVTNDLLTYLTQKNQFDLVIAGDVFVYIGDLDNLFSAISKSLKNNGLFVFNAEINETEEFYMNQSGRFSHSKDYLSRLAYKYNFKIIAYKTAVTRLQNNSTVNGHIFLLKINLPK